MDGGEGIEMEEGRGRRRYKGRRVSGGEGGKPRRKGEVLDGGRGAKREGGEKLVRQAAANASLLVTRTRTCSNE